jgi:hypothetical protein
MQLISYARHQFPPEVIWQAVWFYLRFTLSYRDVEELLGSEALTSPTRWSGNGCSGSVPLSPGTCADCGRGLRELGIWMRW